MNWKEYKIVEIKTSNKEEDEPKKSKEEILKTRLENLKSILNRVSILEVSVSGRSTIFRYLTIDGHFNSAFNAISKSDMSFEDILLELTSENKDFLIIRETHDFRRKDKLTRIFNMKRFAAFSLGNIVQFPGKYGYSIHFYNTLYDKNNKQSIVESFCLEFDRIETLVPIIEYLEKYHKDLKLTKDLREKYEEYRLPSLAKMIKNREKQNKSLITFETTLKNEKVKEEKLLKIFNEMDPRTQERILNLCSEKIHNIEGKNYINELYIQKTQQQN